MILQKMTKGCLLVVFAITSLFAQETHLNVDIFSYQDFANKDPQTLKDLKEALLEKGIIGIKGVPGYKEGAERFILAAREFSALSEEEKNQYAPNRQTGEITGYELGAEKFMRPDGEWTIDDAKASYYAFIPDNDKNRWPEEGLKDAYLEIAHIMFDTGIKLLESIDLMVKNNIDINKITGFGRMLHYRKQSDATMLNPYWCGAHYDHSLITALLPAFYFIGDEPVAEPEEAGLFVRTKNEYKKVVSDDPDVLLFQVGEFGQLAMDDEISATEHRVHKARGGIERFTLAVFYDPALDTVVHSKSVLTKDARYGTEESCTYQRWSEESYKRYLVEETK